MWKDLVLDGRTCHTYSPTGDGPVIFIGIMSDQKESMTQIARSVEEELGESEPFTLFFFESSDWMDDFSPWEMDTGLGQRFGSGGRALSDWLVDRAIPYVREEFPYATETAIVGYSLAGLFSLWTFYETHAFRAVGCCSGSLWFKGWDEYADRARSPENGAVYLSLGGKEPGSGNILTASIGVQYLKQKKRLEGDSALRAYIHQQNSGGHFSDVPGRIVKAVVWIVNALAVY
ncbi:MAG: hypothetical protein MJZ38_08115 [archaeon]|nr:hypothetical protein [archaeon]